MTALIKTCPNIFRALLLVFSMLFGFGCGTYEGPPPEPGFYEGEDEYGEAEEEEGEENEDEGEDEGEENERGR